MGLTVEISDVCKRFGSVDALKNVTLTLGPGTVHCVIGDNGAGKSTLLKVLSGVCQPDCGEIRIAGKTVELTSAKVARRVGIETVHQDLGLVDSMNIARNFFLGAEPTWGLGLLRMRKMRNDTAAALADVGLSRTLDPSLTVDALSGGERQAISIGRAVHFQRVGLVLDEPTAALSVGETRKVFEYVEKAKALGLVVVIVLHNMVQATQVADYVHVMRHGRIVATHKPAECSVELLEGEVIGSG